MNLAMIAYVMLVVASALSSVPLARQALGRPRHSRIVSVPMGRHSWRMRPPRMA